MKLVYYSLSVAGNEYDKNRIAQLITSIETLRRHNAEITVQLHLLGDLPEGVHCSLRALDVNVVAFDSYAELIDKHFNGAGEWLSHYPVMHKYLTMEALTEHEPEQVLYLDSDTYIHFDIEQLFDQYCEADLYAREEPGSRHSPLGYHPGYLNEDALYQLAEAQGSVRIKPFNSGVVLMNHDLWRRLLNVADDYVRFVAGFSKWMIQQPANAYSMPDLVYLQKNKSELIDLLDTVQPLPFPGSNYWIKEQLALWLAVGSVRDAKTGFFERDDVLQGGEELRAPGQLPKPVVSHYYSQNTKIFMDRVDSNLYKGA